MSAAAAPRDIRDKLQQGVRAFEAGDITFQELRDIGDECRDSRRAADRRECVPWA